MTEIQPADRDTASDAGVTIRWDLPDRLDPETRDVMIGPGGFFELADDDVLGQRLPTFTKRARSLGEVVADSARHGDRPFLIEGDTVLTFAATPAAVDAIAARLVRDFGVERGDRVVLAGGVTMAHALTFWAIVRLGAIATVMNPAWTPTELDHAVGLTQPVLAIVDEPVLAKLPRGLPAIAFDPRWIGDSSPAPAPAVVDEDDPAAIIFTSGTTGRAKGATLSHRNIVQFCLAAAATSAVHTLVHGLTGPKGPTTVIGSAPLFHVSGLLGQHVTAALWGGTVVIPPPGRWDERAHLELTERHQVSSWSLVPTQLWRLIEHPDVESFDLSSLTVVGGGGAAFAPELLRRTAERLPHVRTSLRVGYGMTETAGTLSLVQPPVTEAQQASVGPPVAGAEIQIRDEAGAVLPEGEVGEIWARSGQVFLGYWGDDAATAAALDAERWYRTGDFGRIDDGFLYLESRRRDLILRGGENIYPIEIEHRLVEHPAIADAAVVGVDHPTLGQEVKAVVVLRPGAEVTDDDLRAFVAQTLARHKVPAHIERRPDLPRNDTGKVLKSHL